MRKGRLGTMFSMPSTPGLSNYLSGIDERGKEIDILKYVKATEIENLYLIPAGNIPPKNNRNVGKTKKCF